MKIDEKQANCKDLVETLVSHQVCSVIQPINQIILHYSHPIFFPTFQL